MCHMEPESHAMLTSVAIVIRQLSVSNYCSQYTALLSSSRDT